MHNNNKKGKDIFFTGHESPWGMWMQGSTNTAMALKGISSVKAGGPHAIQGKRGKVKTPLTNQAINHLAVSGTVTHSG